jgi:hypothetical protein
MGGQISFCLRFNQRPLARCVPDSGKKGHFGPSDFPYGPMSPRQLTAAAHHVLHERASCVGLFIMFVLRQTIFLLSRWP